LIVVAVAVVVAAAVFVVAAVVVIPVFFGVGLVGLGVLVGGNGMVNEMNWFFGGG
jgi:hypothetical protein